MTTHKTNHAFTCDACKARVTGKVQRYSMLDDACGGSRSYYLLCDACVDEDVLTLDFPANRMVNAYPDCVSAWEMMDEFGRVPFHVNPNAYTRPENYRAFALQLAGVGGDAWLYIPRPWGAP